MESARSDTAAFSGVTVVVVDDNPFELRFMEAALARLGIHRVHSCLNAPMALSTVSKLVEAPVLLICDLNMPDMDGIEFLRAVAQRNFRGSVLIHSGANQVVRAAAANLARAIGLELLGTFAKPIEVDRLAEALLRAVKAQRGHAGGQPTAQP